VIASLRDELTQARSAAQVAEARMAEQTRQVEDLQRSDNELAQARGAALEQARMVGEVTALQP
jgi:hypothetical protein